jgi:hypothetical protein
MELGPLIGNSATQKEEAIMGEAEKLVHGRHR